MKLILAAIILPLIAACATAPPVVPEPLRVGDNLYLLLRDKGRPYLEWADGLKIAEAFCQQRREGKSEIMTVTEPDHIAFQCELGAHHEPKMPTLIQRAPLTSTGKKD